MNHIMEQGFFQKISVLSEKVALFSALAALVALPVARLFVTDLLLIITIVAIALTGHYREKIAILMENPYVKWLPLLFLFYWIAMFYSPASWHMRLDMASKNIRFFYPLLLVPFFAKAARKELLLRAFLWGTLLSSCVALVATLLNKFGLTHFPTPGYLFLNHIAGSLFAAFAAFVCLHKMFSTQGRARYFFIVVFLAAVIHLFLLSTARTGVFEFVALLGLFVIQRRQLKVFLLTALISLITLSVLFSLHGNFSNGLDRVKQDWVLYKQGDAYSSNGLRIVQAKNAFFLWKQRPLFGFGSGAYNVEYFKQGQPRGWLDVHGNVVKSVNDIYEQNQYLSYMVDLGLVGLFLFLAWIGSVCRYAQRLAPDERFAAQGLMLTLILGSFSDQILYLGAPGNFFIIISSVLLAYVPTIKKT